MKFIRNSSFSKTLYFCILYFTGVGRYLFPHIRKMQKCTARSYSNSYFHVWHYVISDRIFWLNPISTKVTRKSFRNYNNLFHGKSAHILHMQKTFFFKVIDWKWRRNELLKSKIWKRLDEIIPFSPVINIKWGFYAFLLPNPNRS